MINKPSLYKKPTYLSISLTFVGVMLIATFLDLKINIWINNPTSFLGNFLGNIGELPYFSSILVAFTILYQSRTWNKGKASALKILCLFGVFLGSFMLWHHLAENFFIANLAYYSVYIVFFALVTSFLAVISTKNINKDIINKLVFFAIFLLLFSIISRLATGLIKEVWQRLRFNYMDHATYSGFTPWYKPNFTSNGREHYVVGGFQARAFRSFISGHTTSAGVSFAVIILPDLFIGLRKYKKLFYIIPATYTAIVAFSRIIIGAHFLSDVTVAFMCSFILASFLRWLYFKNRFFLRPRQFELVTN